MTKHPKHLFPLTLAAMLALPLSAHAQLSKLDPQTLIEGLARENMPELLERSVQNRQSTDPVELLQIRIAKLRLRMLNVSLTNAERQAALDEMMESFHTCITQNMDHEQRPLWQTELCELLLFQLLEQRHQLACQFIEFGVPTIDQQNIFNAIIPQALEQLISADERLQTLQVELPKQPNHIRDRVQTMLWERMIDRYALTRTPYLLCQTAYYATLLSDENPLFSRLSEHYWPGEKKHTASQLKNFLLELCAKRLDQLQRQQSIKVDGLPELVASLLGRVFLAQGKLPEAMSQFENAIKIGNSDLNDLQCRLARARTLECMGKLQTASESLDLQLNHVQAKNNLLARLLVVDARHLYLMRRAQTWPAQTRDQAVLAAYKPYEILLAEKSLGDSAQALDNYIHDRWEGTVTHAADLNAIPLNVLLSVSHRMRSQGQNLLISAKNSTENNTQQILIKQGRARLESAIQICEAMFKRTDLSSAAKSGAMFDMAVCVFYLNPSDFNNQIRTAKILTDLAEQMPEQVVSEQAIKDALAILRPMHAQTPRAPEIAPLYERAGSVLLSKFPTSTVADNERLYFGYAVLQASGKYAQAVDVYSKIPMDHPDYFPAQLQKLVAMQAIFRTISIAEKFKAGQAVDVAAETLRSQAARAITNATPQTAAIIRRSLGPVRLIQADMAIDRGNLETALTLLDACEQEFPDQSALVAQVQQKRFALLIKTGLYEKAATLAQQLVTLNAPDAPAQADALLSRIDERLEQLRLEIVNATNPAQLDVLKGRMTTLARASASLGKFLLSTASTQKIPEESVLVRWKLFVAKSLRMTGNPRESLAMIVPLFENNPNDALLIDALAESHFLLGDAANLQRAAQFYDTLITRLKPENEKYPTLWWNAWMRRLMIADTLSQATNEIPLRIGQLQLIDPNLGGELFKTDFLKLRSKYAKSPEQK